MNQRANEPKQLQHLQCASPLSQNPETLDVCTKPSKRTCGPYALKLASSCEFLLSALGIYSRDDLWNLRDLDKDERFDEP